MEIWRPKRPLPRIRVLESPSPVVHWSARAMALLILVGLTGDPVPR